MHGRTMAYMGPQPQVVPHQASSLASNHASKISHFSKNSQQNQELKGQTHHNPNYSNIHENNTADRTHYHKNRQMD